jgi:hypothetical protein
MKLRAWCWIKDIRFPRPANHSIVWCLKSMKKAPLLRGFPTLGTGARPGSFLASRAKREQGIFDGEGASILFVCERLAGKNNAAIASAAARKRKPRGGGVFRAGQAKLSFHRRERSSCKAGFGEMARSIRFVCERLEPNPNAADASAAGEITSCRPCRPCRRPYRPYQA